MKLCWIATPGLAHDPGMTDGWTDRFVTGIHRRGLGVAEKYEPPEQWPLTRWFKYKSRAGNLAVLVSDYTLDGYRTVLTGHSNGGVTATDAIRLFNVGCDVLNLIAPACHADFNRNGLNQALGSGRVGRVNVWISGRDGWLKLANVSRKLFGWTGLGFGTLGKHGPQNVDPAFADRVVVHRKPDWNHSDYFTPANFDAFLDELVKASTFPA